MKYLAIGFWFDNQDFSFSVYTDSDDPIEVSDQLSQAAHQDSKDYLAVVLLVENGQNGDPPKVLKFWRGENGDFESVARQIH